MLSPLNIEKMRQTAREKLPTPAKILRRSKIADDFGKKTFQYVESEQTVCRVWGYTSREPNEANSLRGPVKFAFPALTDIGETDQIETETGEKFAVIGLITQKSFEITREVEAKSLGLELRRPMVPILSATSQEDGVEFTWNPALDESGVSEYELEIIPPETV